MAIWFVNQFATGAADGQLPKDAFTTIAGGYSAASDGDTVQVVHTHTAAVTYSEQIQILKDGVQVIGPGFGLATITPPGVNDHCVILQAPGARVSGFRLATQAGGTANGAIGWASDVRLDNCWISYSTSHATSLQYDRSVMEGCLISGTIGGDGMRLQAASRCVIRDCRFIGCAANGIYVTNATCEHNLIEGCHMLDNSSNGIIMAADADWTICRGCTFRGNVTSSVYHLGDDCSLVDCVLGDATTYNASSAGARFQEVNCSRTHDGHPVGGFV